MTKPDRPIGEDDVQAYVDERLPADQSLAFEAYLREHPEASRRIAAYRKQRQALKDLFAARDDDPLPVRLRVSTILANRRLSMHRRLRTVAAAFCWLVVGVAGGWFANGIFGRDLPVLGMSAHLSAMTRDAVSAHRTFAVEVVHPVEVRADQLTHLGRWIAKRLGRDLVIPDLTDAGFRLMGGRVLPAGLNAAVQLMYEDPQGMRLTLYVRVLESGTTAFRFVREDDVSAFYWIDDGCGYVVSAAIDRDRLLAIAESVFHQLEGAGESQKPSL